MKYSPKVNKYSFKCDAYIHLAFFSVRVVRKSALQLFFILFLILYGMVSLSTAAEFNEEYNQIKTSLENPPPCYDDYKHAVEVLETKTGENGKDLIEYLNNSIFKFLDNEYTLSSYDDHLKYVELQIICLGKLLPLSKLLSIYYVDPDLNNISFGGRQIISGIIYPNSVIHYYIKRLEIPIFGYKRWHLYLDSIIEELQKDMLVAPQDTEEIFNTLNYVYRELTDLKQYIKAISPKIVGDSDAQQNIANYDLFALAYGLQKIKSLAEGQLRSGIFRSFPNYQIYDSMANCETWAETLKDFNVIFDGIWKDVYQSQNNKLFEKVLDGGTGYGGYYWELKDSSYCIPKKDLIYNIQDNTTTNEDITAINASIEKIDNLRKNFDDVEITIRSDWIDFIRVWPISFIDQQYPSDIENAKDLETSFDIDVPKGCYDVLPNAIVSLHKGASLYYQLTFPGFSEDSYQKAGKYLELFIDGELINNGKEVSFVKLSPIGEDGFIWDTASFIPGAAEKVDGGYRWVIDIKNTSESLWIPWEPAESENWTHPWDHEGNIYLKIDGYQNWLGKTSFIKGIHARLHFEGFYIWGTAKDDQDNIKPFLKIDFRSFSDNALSPPFRNAVVETQTDAEGRYFSALPTATFNETYTISADGSFCNVTPASVQVDMISNELDVVITDEGDITEFSIIEPVFEESESIDECKYYYHEEDSLAILGTIHIGCLAPPLHLFLSPENKGVYEISLTPEEDGNYSFSTVLDMADAQDVYFFQLFLKDNTNHLLQNKCYQIIKTESARPLVTVIDGASDDAFSWLNEDGDFIDITLRLSNIGNVAPKKAYLSLSVPNNLQIIKVNDIPITPDSELNTPFFVTVDGYEVGNYLPGNTIYTTDNSQIQATYQLVDILGENIPGPAAYSDFKITLKAIGDQTGLSQWFNYRAAFHQSVDAPPNSIYPVEYGAYITDQQGWPSRRISAWEPPGYEDINVTKTETGIQIELPIEKTIYTCNLFRSDIDGIDISLVSGWKNDVFLDNTALSDRDYLYRIEIIDSNGIVVREYKVTTEYAKYNFFFLRNSPSFMIYNPQEGFEEGDIITPSVLKTSGGYRMHYSCQETKEQTMYGSCNYLSIGSSYSADGAVWTPSGNNPIKTGDCSIIRYSYSGGFQDQDRYTYYTDPFILQTGDGSYRMYAIEHYYYFDTSCAPAPCHYGYSEKYQIITASSQNGIDWSDFEETTIVDQVSEYNYSGSFPEHPSIIASPSVIISDGVYQMWYEKDGQVCLALSEDGVHFEEDTEDLLRPYFYSNTDVTFKDPFVTKDGFTYYMFIMADDLPDKGDKSICLFLSCDGQHWKEYANNPIISPIWYDDFPFEKPSACIDHKNNLFELWVGYGDGVAAFKSELGPHVGPPYITPVAVAGEDRSETAILQMNQELHLSGEESFGGAFPLDYNWRQVEGPEVEIQGEGPNRTFIPQSKGSYVFELIVTDGIRQSAPDRITVTVEEMPSLPVIGSANVSEEGRGVFVSGSYAYLVTKGGSFVVIDIQNPQSPEIVGSCLTYYGDDVDACHMSTGGSNYVNISLGTEKNYNNIGTYQSIRINDPENPVYLSPDLYFSGGAMDRVKDGFFSYFASGAQGISVVSFLDIEGPYVKQIDIPGKAWGLFMEEDILYVAARDGGLIIMDIVDPLNPKIISNIQTPGDAMNVSVSGEYAYVADYEAGLTVVDVGNPLYPKIVSTTYTGGAVRNLELTCAYAFVADEINGLCVIDISNPLEPQVASQTRTNYPSKQGAWDVFINGSFAYLAESTAGILIFDISDYILGIPGTPDSISASDDDYSDLIRINWNVSLDATEYEIWRSDKNDIDSALNVATTSRTFYSDYSAKPGVIYYYWVRAINECGISDWSNDDTGFYRNGIPLPPEHFSASYGRYMDRVKLMWREPSLATCYEIWRSTTNDESSAVLIASCVTGTSYDDTSATSKTPLYYWIKAKNDHGISGFSSSMKGYVQGGALSIVGLIDTLPYVNWTGIDISGTYAYLAHGSNGIYIIDIKDPKNPVSISNLLTTGPVNNVRVKGDFAYVGEESSGMFEIINISSPQSPEITGSIDLSNYVNGFEVTDSYAYVCAGNQLKIIDIEEPENPFVAGSVTVMSSYMNIIGVKFSGNYAYVDTGCNGFKIVDISDPQNPFLIGSKSCSGTCEPVGLDISGTYAYLANQCGEFKVLNISDPLNLELVGSLGLNINYVHYITVSESYAFITHGSGTYADTIEIVDVSDPRNPILAGSADISSNDICCIGNYAYIATDTGLTILSTSDPHSPPLISTIDTPGCAEKAFISGHYAYMADWRNGLHVINIQNPDNPEIVASVDTPGYAGSVVVSGTHAYVADGESGLEIIDISDPNVAEIVSSVDTPGNAKNVVVSGPCAYIADGKGGLQVVDIQNLSYPELIASVDTPGYAWSVFVSGFYAYMADGDSGLAIIDITDPYRPKLIRSIDTPGDAVSVFASDKYVYVADSDGFIQVIDARDIQTASIVASFYAESDVKDIYLYKQYLYIAESNGFSVVDISDPLSPAWVDTALRPNYSRGIYVTGSHVFLSICIEGMEIFKNPIGYAIPSPPQNLSATKGTYTEKVELTWEASPGAVLYEVWRSNRNEHSSEICIAPDIQSTFYNDNTISKANTYNYWIKAKNADGTSDFSIGDIGYIGGSGTPPIVDSFIADAISGRAPMDVTYTISGHDIDGSITEYHWDFDGNGITDKITTSGIASYKYEIPGIFPVFCNVVDDYGSETTSKSINIYVYPSSTDLSISLAATSDIATAGDFFSYNLSVKNEGPSDATNISVTHDIPTYLVGCEYSLNSGQSWDVWEGSLVINTLDSGKTMPILISGKIDSSATGVINYTASVNSEITDPDMANNSIAEISTPITTSADVSISLAATSDIATAGDFFSYNLSVKNEGPSDATNITLIHETSTYLVGCEYSLNNGQSWDVWEGSLVINTLDSGKTMPILISGKIDSSATGVINYTASVNSEITDPDMANNSIAEISTPITTSADLSIIISDDPDPANADKTVGYKIIINNHGPSKAVAVNVISSISTDSFIISSDATQGTVTQTDDSRLLWNFGEIESGANAMSTFVIGGLERVCNMTTIATVTSETNDINISNNSITENTAVIAFGDFDRNGGISLPDAILSLQFLSGKELPSYFCINSDINGDRQIGLQEVIFILQKISGFRE